jgi:hypothetical protein
MTTKTTKYITVSTLADAWGDTTSAKVFHVRDEAYKIAAAASDVGVEAIVDEYPRDLRDDDGNERIEIDWFTTWCREGYQWFDWQWKEFFDACA